MLDTLRRSQLFADFQNEQIEHLLRFIGTETATYKDREPLYLEDDECDRIGIILKGAVELQTIFQSGKVITHLTLGPSDVFGEGLLFSAENRYPVSIHSKGNSEILYIRKDHLIHGLLHHPILLQNFLSLLSNKLYFMNNKVKILSLSTLRKKIAFFLLEQYRLRGTRTFEIPLNRKRLAEHLAVERPSLSRELIRMREDGLIDFEQSSFKILDLEALEDDLL